MHLALPNLAAFRYRNIMASTGGPVAALQMAEMTVLGRREFLANAYLLPGLAEDDAARSLYSSAHGSGTASSSMMARFMAVSEAMERWAHWQLHRSPAGGRYGFDVDPSSNGMAAFPGLFRSQARDCAQMEATERFNLLHWWEGSLPAVESATDWPGVRAVTICSEAPGVTVILFCRTALGYYCYGHAAAMEYKAACHKAAIEMERHSQVITRFAQAHANRLMDGLPEHARPIERRCLFFATETGHEMFIGRVRSAPRRMVSVRPQCVYDGPIPGPWGKYADVWRVVYIPPSNRFLEEGENYFLW